MRRTYFLEECYCIDMFFFFVFLHLDTTPFCHHYVPGSHRSSFQALCFVFSVTPSVCSGGLSSKYLQRGFSIDPGVRQATSHGTGLFMRRRSNFFRLLRSQGPPFFSVMQRCVCAYLISLTKEGRDPIHFCLWHSPLVFTIFPRRAVCTVEQALSWRSGTMASTIM